MKLIHGLITAGFFFLSLVASAQQIQTDRPNETESPNTVTPHHLQIESGFSFEKEDEEKTFKVPELVLRYGIFKNAELRVESAFKIEQEENIEQCGIEPVAVGFKYHLLDHKNAVPDLGIIGRVTIPWLADNSYQQQKYSPEIRLLAQHEVSKSAHLGYNLGVHWQPDALQPEYIYTLSADYSISKKIKFVAESYGFVQSHHHAENSVDIAVLYLINDNMQLDFITGSGIMHSYTEKFIEVGLSFRI
jgi:hypothetical protein